MFNPCFEYTNPLKGPLIFSLKFFNQISITINDYEIDLT